MNEEKLHDAIGEIDDELIEKADKYRNKPREIKLPKTRMLVTAACFIAAVSLSLVTAKFVSDNMNLISDDGDNVGADTSRPIQNESATELSESEAQGGDPVDQEDGSGTTPVSADCAGPVTPENDKVTEAVNIGSNDIILYNELTLPSYPQNIESYAFRYANGTYSGKNIEYTDSAFIRESDVGLLVGFSIYQDSLDYTAGLIDILDGCITVDYDNNTYDRIDRANKCITAAVNGEPCKISEVRLGKGNGHVDYCITVVRTNGNAILLSELSDIIIDIVRPDSDASEGTVPDGGDIPASDEAATTAPLIIPRIELDDSFAIPEESIGYFNYDHRTYILWQELQSDMGTGPELFKVTNTLTEKPYDFYENYGGNMNASVCAITGFNTDFALAANIGGKYYICICLNDINLYSVRDLLCTRFGLDRLYHRSAYELVGNPSVTVFTEEKMHSEVYESFMTALFDSEFVTKSKLLMHRLATVSFMTDDGIKLSINLYEGGYVTLGNVNDFANMMLKLDEDTFDAFVDSLEEREFDADKFASFVTSADRKLLFVTKPIDGTRAENYIYFFDDESSLLPLIYYTADRGNTVKPIEYSLGTAPASDIKEVGNILTAVGDGYEFGFFIELILSDGSTVYASFNNYANANMYEWTKFNFIGYASDIIAEPVTKEEIS